MFGKIFSAYAGAQAAKHTTAIGGTGGAVLGVVALPIVRRLSIPALIVLGASGYAVKKLLDRNKVEPAQPTDTAPAS